MFREFRAFAVRGSVVDMAVGIVIGAAFGRIVTSFVNDILMPPIGLLTGDADFSALFLNLSGGTYPTLEAAQEAGAVTINYGVWLNAVTDFLIVAVAVFVLVRWLNRLKKTEEEAPKPPPEPSKEERLLTEIRDALRAR